MCCDALRCYSAQFGNDYPKFRNFVKHKGTLYLQSNWLDNVAEMNEATPWHCNENPDTGSARAVKQLTAMIGLPVALTRHDDW